MKIPDGLYTRIHALVEHYAPKRALIDDGIEPNGPPYAINQSALARELGVSQPTVCQFLGGERTIGLDKLFAYLLGHGVRFEVSVTVEYGPGEGIDPAAYRAVHARLTSNADQGQAASRDAPRGIWQHPDPAHNPDCTLACCKGRRLDKRLASGELLVRRSPLTTDDDLHITAQNLARLKAEKTSAPKRRSPVK
jgi:transcriptional regulator with XRE-family HTH domain